MAYDDEDDRYGAPADRYDPNDAYGSDGPASYGSDGPASYGSDGPASYGSDGPASYGSDGMPIEADSRFAPRDRRDEYSESRPSFWRRLFGR